MERKIIDSKVTTIDESGIPHIMGRVNEQSKHVKYLLDYININHLDIDVSNLSLGNADERLAYQLALLGDITYLNGNNFGMFYFPDELTEEQLETLNNIDLGNQKVGLCFDMVEVEGNIMRKVIGMNNDCTLRIALEEYLTRKNTKNFRR